MRVIIMVINVPSWGITNPRPESQPRDSPVASIRHTFPRTPAGAEAHAQAPVEAVQRPHQQGVVSAALLLRQPPLHQREVAADRKSVV